MPKKPNKRPKKSGTQKHATIRKKASTKSASPSRKRAVAASRLSGKSALRGGATVIIVRRTPGRYRLYGSKSGPLGRQIASKSSATRIVGRLGIPPRVVREVDSVIANLRLRKKIG